MNSSPSSSKPDAPAPAPARAGQAAARPAEDLRPWYADSLAWLRWLQARPAAAALVVAILAVLAGFLGFVKPFSRETISAFSWMWSAWNPETHYEHGPFIPCVFLFLVWNAQSKLRQAQTGSSKWGLAFLGFGVLLYLVAARALQPRLALAALPFLLFGAILYVWGRQIARALLFPCAFLFFMIPLPGVDQATVGLQLIATNMARAVCNTLGLHLVADGTTLRAADGGFQFEIADGCSGINSFMAITMLTAVFVHLTQDRLWKKVALFAASGVFAIIGNIARLTSIMFVAKFFGQKFAGGPFHDYSAFIVSFPFAFGSMWLASKVVNWRPTAEQKARWFRPAAAGTGSPALADRALNPAPAGAVATAAPRGGASRPSTTYDY